MLKSSAIRKVQNILRPCWSSQLCFAKGKSLRQWLEISVLHILRSMMIKISIINTGCDTWFWLQSCLVQQAMVSLKGVKVNDHSRYCR